MVAGAKFLNAGIIVRLLATKLVAGEAKDLKTFVFVFVIESL